MIGQVVQCTQCGAKTTARLSKCPGRGGQLLPEGTSITPTHKVAMQDGTDKSGGRKALVAVAVAVSAVLILACVGVCVVGPLGGALVGTIDEATGGAAQNLAGTGDGLKLAL